MDRYILRPATTIDVASLYPEGLRNSIRAWVLSDKITGVIYGIGGVILVNDQYTAFLKKSLEGRIPPITAWKAILKGLKNIKNMGITVTAIRDRNLKSSCKLLYRLGFEFSHMSKGQEIYICKP